MCRFFYQQLNYIRHMGNHYYVHECQMFAVTMFPIILVITAFRLGNMTIIKL